MLVPKQFLIKNVLSVTIFIETHTLNMTINIFLIDTHTGYYDAEIMLEELDNALNRLQYQCGIQLSLAITRFTFRGLAV